MSERFNPFTEKLDYFFPATSGINRFKFLGTTADDATDPGYGNMKFDLSGEGLGEVFSAIFSLKDLDGSVFYSLPQLIAFGVMDVYEIWLYVHSKSDPKMCVGMLITDMEAIVDGEDNTVAYRFPCLPWIWPLIWAEDWEEWVSRDFVDGEDVLISWDFAFNSSYIGSLGTQDSDTVGISGGTISSTDINSVNSSYLRIPVKEDTGDPASPENGQIYNNEFDHKIRIYAGGEWRTLLDYSA